MSYVERNLNDGENVIYRTSLHWITILAWPVLFGVLGIGCLAGAYYVTDTEWLDTGFWWAGWIGVLIGVLTIFFKIMLNKCSEFAVTDRRVVIKTGLIHRKTLEVILQKVESIGVEQTIMGRILGYGTLIVTGSGGSSEPYKNIGSPLTFRRAVQEQIEKLDTDDD